MGISASRVGGKAQTKAMKSVAGKLRLDLAQYRELAAFTQFGSEMDASTEAQLRRGERMVEILKQDKNAPNSLSEEIMILFAGTNGFLDSIPLHLVKKYERELYIFMDKEYPDVPELIRTKKEVDAATTEKLRTAVSLFTKEFKEKWPH